MGKKKGGGKKKKSKMTPEEQAQMEANIKRYNEIGEDHCAHRGAQLTDP